MDSGVNRMLCCVTTNCVSTRASSKMRVNSKSSTMSSCDIFQFKYDNQILLGGGTGPLLKSVLSSIHAVCLSCTLGWTMTLHVLKLPNIALPVSGAHLNGYTGGLDFSLLISIPRNIGIGWRCTWVPLTQPPGHLFGEGVGISSPFALMKITYLVCGLFA